MGMGIALIFLSFFIATYEPLDELYLCLSLFALVLTIAVYTYEKYPEGSIWSNKKRTFSITDFLLVSAAPISLFLTLLIGSLFAEGSLPVLTNAISLISVGVLLLTISLKTK